MKIKTILLVLCLTCTVAFAEQRAVVVTCRDGQPALDELNILLKQGWRVVVATPVTDSDSVSVFGKPKQAFTATIVYIVEKN